MLAITACREVWSKREASGFNILPDPKVIRGIGCPDEYNFRVTPF
jgi:hypothetical protein